MTTSNSAPMVSVPVDLVNDLHLIDSQGETPDGDGVTVNVQLWAERWTARLAAAPAPQPVQGEADEHRMMMDDLRLYGTAFSKNGKRIPPEEVYITQPPAPAVGEAQRKLSAHPAVEGDAAEVLRAMRAASQQCARFADRLDAAWPGMVADSARLDYIERTFSGMTNRERYLPVQMIWGKGCNGRTLREACDKYMKRDAALLPASPADGEK